MPHICLFCDNQIDSFDTGSDSTRVKCPGCGLYYITREAFEDVNEMSLTQRQKSNISGWLHDNQRFTITSTNLEWLNALPALRFHEQADKLLMKLEKCTTYAGEFLEIKVDWFSGAWCIKA